MGNHRIPEPPAEPPEEPFTVAGGCGHEVYEGEPLVEWHDGCKIVLLCEECFRERLFGLTTPKLAYAFNCGLHTVSRI